MSSDKINFFTCANDRYSFFIPIYIYFVLKYNPNSFVEIVVESEETKKSLVDFTNAVVRRFGERVLLRIGSFQGLTPNIVRFVEEPVVKLKYTYIGDIDIFVVEDVASWHIPMLGKLDLPHTNIIRHNQKRMTGLHFFETDKHYPIDFNNFNIYSKKTTTDEEFLYHIYSEKGLLPSPDHKKRPEHGIHVSLNRCPFDKKGWGMNEIFFDRTIESIGELLSPEFVNFLSEKTIWILKFVKISIESKYIFSDDELQDIRFLGRSKREQEILNDYYRK